MTGKFVCIFMLAGLTFSSAQTPTANVRFRGIVFDTSRSPIAGARVTALENGHEPGFLAITGDNGEFALDLSPGLYTIKVNAGGFLERSESLSVSEDQAAPHQFILTVEGVHETVTVAEQAGYRAEAVRSGTKTLTPLRDIPQSISVVTRELITDQMMMSMGDVVRYVPGITAIQGENNRDQIVIRGNNSSADFFLNGVRDDVQYYRDLYNIDRVEALKGPNAMIFGRGGGGGVVNRVTKEADFMASREVEFQGGSFGTKRFTTDLDQPFTSNLALRLNGLYENSDSFRNFVSLERYGINPTLSIAPTNQTRITLGYEYFRDFRTADRGIPSFQGKPIDTDVSTYFGNPDASHVRALVNIGTLSVEHSAGLFNIRNRTSFGAYDRGYQNFVPGAVTADGTQDSLSAYNNATARLNIFNQTDMTYTLSRWGLRHTLLGGVEVGRQLTDNFRNTGYFNNTSTSVLIPLADPVIDTPVTFRQSATDASNHLTTNLAASYVQDQIDLSRNLQIIAGLRFDYFDLQYHDNRTGNNLRRIDNLLSPRGGLVFKPRTALSIYSSFSVSYLPSSGDQFSSLTTITQQVKPEKFINYEIGAKWDLLRSLSATAALYRLDRTNTRATDPNDPTRIIQTGSQRTNGIELGLTGSITRAWKVAGGYAYQHAFVTGATTAAPAGAQVAQVPRNTFSLWNNYQIRRRLGAGLGILNRSDMFAAIDNTVVLPGYTRADAAVFYSLAEKVRLQVNVENLFNARYYLNADSNTNISPGSSRAVRVGLTARF